MLAEKTSLLVHEELHSLARSAAGLPRTIAHFAAGEVGAEIVLADMYSLLSSVRLAETSGALEKQSAHILSEEFERLAERFSLSLHPSPFISSDDLSIPIVAPEDSLTSLSGGKNQEFFKRQEQKDIKDENKGLAKKVSQGQEDRRKEILDFVYRNKGVSIKDISAVVRGYSEKTIQRELAALILLGLVHKTGERRWSLYFGI